MEEFEIGKGRKVRAWRKCQGPKGLHSDKGGTIQEGKLYKRLPRDILLRCVSEKEGKQNLEELHSQTCGTLEKINLYRRIQCMGYYWPNISKDDAVVQEKCQNCPLSMNKEESYVVFIAEDWRTPLIEYLAQGTLQA